MPVKVFAAIPSHDLSRFPEFWATLMTQDLPPGVTMTPALCRGTYIAENQNNMARQFMAGDFDYFWLTNDDQVYPPDTLARLLSHRAGVVAPVCLERSAPFRPLVYDRFETHTGRVFHRFLNDGKSGLIEVAATGGGGMLISRRVLEKVKDPWWEVRTVRANGTTPTQMSEDIDFCHKAHAAGFSVLCDTSIVVGHNAVFTIWPQRDESGKWCTALERSQQKIMLPAAVPG